MVVLDSSVLENSQRLRAVRLAEQMVPRLAMPLDAIARAAAHLLGAPMAAATLVGPEQEIFAGVRGLPPELTAGRRADVTYSVCKYVVSVDAPVEVPDMLADADPQLREHPLAVQYGVRAFLGVPLRDTDDQVLGSLTVFDTVPRSWTAEQLTTLVELSTLIGPLLDTPPPGEPGANSPVVGLGQAVTDALDGEGFVAALLDSVQAGVVVCDNDGQSLLFNRASRQMYAIPDAATPRQAMTNVVARLHHPDRTPMASDELAITRALQGRPIRDAEELLLVPGQPERYLQVNSQPIPAADGSRQGAVSTIVDVTARRRTQRFRDCEMQVADILTRHDTVAEAVPRMLRAVSVALGWPYLTLWLVDAVSDSLLPAGHHAAAGHEDLTGLLPQRIGRNDRGLGRVWTTGQAIWVPALADLDPTRMLTPGAAAFIQACVARGMHTLAAVAVPSGDTTLGVLSGVAQTAEHDEFLITGLLAAIADRFGYYLSRHHADHLARQLDHAKNDLVALVGHELRTPLTAITAYTQMLLDDPSPDPADDRQYLQAIDRNGTKLRALVDDLLDLAALDAGTLPLNDALVDLCDLVAAAGSDNQPTAAIAELTVRCDLRPHVTVTGDPDRLRQLADRLITYAIGATPAGGHVAVALDLVDGAAELTVTHPRRSDDDPVDLYQRLSDTNTTGLPATGGATTLALARIITELHHGTITVHPDQGGTTTITVRLPATDRHAAFEHSKEDTMATVLIGENVPDIAAVVQRLFARAGYQTRLTTTGDAALAGALADIPDLIVMNPSLPGIDGLDICRKLRAESTTQHIPIMLLSVRHHPAEQAAARAAGADDYIGKPFNNKDLLTRAHTLLQTPRPLHDDPSATPAS
ncbi:response regulator [Actinoplanes sp. CA-015351]|uniref:response regulator n=1 Tax=Actinoplanes sp. CA-015351 TaxID=3239897 RepID=UPI003D956F80